MKANNSGVYQIRNIINNKRYIGSSSSIKKRWYYHRSALRKGVHHSILLQRAWNKYGEINFVFEIIKEVLEKSYLIEIEQHYKDLYKSYDRKYGYDICKTAGSRLGSKCSNETKMKASLFMRKLWEDLDYRNKMLIALRGRKFSDNARANISISHKGKKRGPMPERQKLAISTTLSGTHRSAKTKAKLSTTYSDGRMKGQNNPMSKTNIEKRKLKRLLEEKSK